MNPFGLRSDRPLAEVPLFISRVEPCDGQSIVVYDADGTLWTNDVADDFTLWMIDQGRVPGEKWASYMRIYRDDPPMGCRYLLNFYLGLTLGELAESVDFYWEHHAARAWVWEVIESLHLLKERGYPVWVVSGTPTDFLLPLVKILGVDQIVGMDFALDPAGKINGKPLGIPCAGTGKAKKLESLLQGKSVKLCVGNGSLDGPMMELAELAWSVYPNPDFARYSKERGWPILPRPADFVEEEKFVLED